MTGNPSDSPAPPVPDRPETGPDAPAVDDAGSSVAGRPAGTSTNTPGWARLLLAFALGTAVGAAIVYRADHARRPALQGPVAPNRGGAVIVDIRYDQKDPTARQAIQVGPGDVLLCEVPTGQRAVVQFTEVAAGHATYRWRYRRSPSTEVLSGVGEVTEKYERAEAAPNRSEVVPLPGHDTVVRAGEIRAEWSSRNGESGYFYYHPARATVRVLPRDSFDIDL